MSFNNAAISVTNLSKRYEIYERPLNRLKQFFMPRARKILNKAQKQYFREFWALSDVTFEIRKGETVGIIGRNGAGKSTLLQIVCGTLTPTTGMIEISGRVAALLELGSGFNIEFTGRENVYMNAGVLGLSREEIDARFQDIVAFAEIGDFLDQPVKTYSSGMYVRLAFSVVVHVNPDILIVDEALSVGDMYFQAKCMLKMKKLMESGVTVLFVSHDVGAVKALCNRAIYLENGKIIAMGTTEEVVEAYYGAGVKTTKSTQTPQVEESPKSTSGFVFDSLVGQNEFVARAAFHRLQNGMAELLNVQLIDENGSKLAIVDFGQTVVLRTVFKGNLDLSLIGLGYHIRDRNGLDIIYTDTNIERCNIRNLCQGEIVIIDWEFKVCLQEGNYTVAVMLSIPQDTSIGKVEVCDFAPLATNFQVIRGRSEPIYGAVYWENKVSQQRITI